MRADAGVQIVGFHLAPVSTALTLFFSWAPLLVIGEAALDQRWPRADELVGLGAYAVGISLLMMSDTPATATRPAYAAGLGVAAVAAAAAAVAALHEAPRELRAPCPRCTPTAGSNTRTAATPTLSLCVRALPDLSASTAQSLRAALHAASNTCVCRHSSENEPAQAWRRINRCAPFPRPRPARATLVWHPSVRFGKLGSFGFAGFLRGEKTAAPERSNAPKMLPLAQERWAGGAAALWR